MSHQACIIRSLSVTFAQHCLFQQLSFQLPFAQCAALIGRNGQGKSLLMSMLNHFDPALATGEIDWQCQYAYLAQFHIPATTIAEALNVQELYQIFQRIEHHQASFADFDHVEHLWHLPQQWQQILSDANLPIDLSFPCHQLSEGQKTKLALCRLFLLKDHYLLLDEPSNHLDAASRQWLIRSLQQHPAGCLMISHDRNLLRQMQHIYALQDSGIKHYQGNYDHYLTQYQLQVEALARNVNQQKRELKQLKIQQHDSLMKAQKRQQTGKKIRESGSQAKILLDYQKEQATQSQSALKQQQQRQIQQSRQQLQQKQLQLEKIQSQRFQFSFPQHKTGEILRLKDIILPFASQQKITLALSAGEKIHVVGNNGAGKSTLLKTIAGLLKPKSGDIFCKAKLLYLDQNFYFGDQQLNALAQLKPFNPQYSDSEWRNLLGQLGIRGDKALYPLHQLSGGEKLKVALLGLSQHAEAIDLLLLDEPENHLDIESRELLAAAISSFTGTVILVSHDQSFVEECGINTTFTLS